MNIFAGIGKIVGAEHNGKVLRFDLAIKQEKPCYVPCVIFEPDQKIRKLIKQIETGQKLIALQGRVSSFEFESYGKTVRKVNIITYPKGITLL